MALSELYKIGFIKEIFEFSKKQCCFTLNSDQIDRNVWEILASENQGSLAVCYLQKLHTMNILKT